MRLSCFRRRFVLGAAGFAAVAFLAGLGGYAIGTANAASSMGEKQTVIFEQKLATIPGKTLTALTVDYAPGGTSSPHSHARSAEVFAYVVSGAIRSKVNDGEESVYRAGQFWYEPPGATHSVSVNASATDPARLLAVFVADDGAELTTVLP
jgi:quercetin dioxygenase-like cupin family protein